jgi:hypothetical protein
MMSRGRAASVKIAPVRRFAPQNSFLYPTTSGPNKPRGLRLRRFLRENSVALRREVRQCGVSMRYPFYRAFQSEEASL